MPWLVGVGVGSATAVLWLLGGGLAQLGTSAGVWLAIGQVAGFTAALAAMAGLILAARPSWLERDAGLDRLWAWHRVTGMTTVFALMTHIVATLVGFGNGRVSLVPSALIDLLTTESWMVAALVAAVLIVTVALTSWRRIRMRMNYETWYFVHLTGYLAVLLGSGHQLTVGTDLAADSPAHIALRWWWIGLAVATVAVVVWSRFGGLLRAVVSGRAVVVATSVPARNTVALELATRGRARADAGQFFMLRFLTRDLWWQSHPISMSARPVGDRLRFTIRVVGDGSAAMAAIRPGTRVLLEGPYGRFTAERAQGRPVVLIGGGVGLAPLRALLEDCGPAQRPIVVARVRDRGALPHGDELRRLTAAKGGQFYVVDGPRAKWRTGEPFHEQMLIAAIPDIAQRDVFVCGPPTMKRAVERGLRRAGVRSDRIHVERFGV